MKNIFFSTAMAVCAAFTITSCSKQAVESVPSDQLSTEDAAMITAAGLKPSGAVKADGGYLIEGDIFLTAEELQAMGGNSGGSELIVANSEQYRTTYLVTGLPRTIKVRYTGSYTSLSNALTTAVNRYNALGLRITFQKVSASTSANITISDVSGASYIASAGFPTSSGSPYSSIKFNTTYASWNANTLASTIAHEIGHCIGFRHTDYMNRAYSCGGSFYNEGTAGVGAVRVPGTPSTADPNSWMLACIGNGVNRPFNANDITALNYLY